jgi:hypothetical protein
MNSKQLSLALRCTLSVKSQRILAVYILVFFQLHFKFFLHIKGFGEGTLVRDQGPSALKQATHRTPALRWIKLQVYF